MGTLDKKHKSRLTMRKINDQTIQLVTGMICDLADGAVIEARWDDSVDPVQSFLTEEQLVQLNKYQGHTWDY